jgi:hypothetical protein
VLCEEWPRHSPLPLCDLEPKICVHAPRATGRRGLRRRFGFLGHAVIIGRAAEAALPITRCEPRTLNVKRPGGFLARRMLATPDEPLASAWYQLLASPSTVPLPWGRARAERARRGAQ